MENWRQIEGFEDYMVSDQGRVWTHKRNRILGVGRNNCGYLHVQLWKNGKEFTKRIHRIVAEHFIPNPKGLPEVHHIDEDKTNNAVSNLQWVSSAFNTEFSKAGYYVLFNENDERVEIYNMRKFARENNLSQVDLKNVAKGKANSYYGYTAKPNTKYKMQRKGEFRLVSPDGEVVTFQKQTEAADYIGVNSGNISELISGKRKSYKGWTLP